MKVVVVALALLVAGVSRAEEGFSLEARMEATSPDSPPPAVSRLVRKKEKKDLDNCRKEKHYTTKEMNDFFGAAAINLNDDGKTDYLLYPKKYCGTMFGAHAIPYWVVLSSAHGYRLVKSGASDLVKVLDSKTNGTRDIVTTYGEEKTRYIFDGRKYRISQ